MCICGCFVFLCVVCSSSVRCASISTHTHSHALDMHDTCSRLSPRNDFYVNCVILQAFARVCERIALAYTRSPTPKRQLVFVVLDKNARARANAPELSISHI